MQRSLTTTTLVDNAVKMFTVGPNGTLYDLETSGALWQRSVTGWSFLDGGVSSILLPQNGGILDLEQGGGLWQYTSRGWVRWAPGVTALAPALAPFQVQITDATGSRTLGAIQSSAQTSSGNAFYELLINGELWQYKESVWSLLDVRKQFCRGRQ